VLITTNVLARGELYRLMHVQESSEKWTYIIESVLGFILVMSEKSLSLL
jgi:hypothetical protein